MKTGFVFRRYVYGLLMVAGAFLLSGCGASKGNIRHHGSRGESGMTSAYDTSSLTGLRKKIVDEAISWIGTPYRYAGSDKGDGTDCSGMVMRVYEDMTGTKIPRNSAKQADFCDKLKERDVLAGDLVFFATGKDPDTVSHVGIMIDNDNFVHASTAKGVVVSKVSAPYYSARLKKYGRVPGKLFSGK